MTPSPSVERSLDILRAFVVDFEQKISGGAPYTVAHLLTKLQEEVDELDESYENQPSADFPATVDRLELADCMFVLAFLAHRAGIDLEEALQAKYDIVKDRTYERMPDGTFHHIKAVSGA